MAEFDQPIDGTLSVEGLDWLKMNWSRDAAGRKTIHVVMEGIALIPYVRQTKGSRYRRDYWGERCRKYNDQQAMLRDALVFKMKEMQEYGNMGYDNKRLMLSTTIDVSEAGRLAVCDLGNLIKAIEDVCNKSVMSDDRHVFRYGVSEKREGETDKIEFEVSEM